MALTLSLQIQHYLNQRLQEQFGEFYLLRARIHGGETHLLNEAADAVDRLYPQAFHQCMAEIDTHDNEGQAIANLARKDSKFKSRVKQLALEAVMSEPLATHVNIMPAGFQEVLEGSPYSFACEKGFIHAVVVEHLAHTTNEIFPLMIDAYVSSFNPFAERHWNVIGTHVDWCNEFMQAERGFFYDAQSESLIEMPFEEPVNLDRLHFLCMTPKTHKQISEIISKFSVSELSEINSYTASQTADDKYQCYQIWKSENLYTPPAAFLGRDTYSSIQSLSDAIQ